MALPLSLKRCFYVRCIPCTNNGLERLPHWYIECTLVSFLTYGSDTGGKRALQSSLLGGGQLHVLWAWILNQRRSKQSTSSPDLPAGARAVIPSTTLAFSWFNSLKFPSAVAQLIAGSFPSFFHFLLFLCTINLGHLRDFYLSKWLYPSLSLSGK